MKNNMLPPPSKFLLKTQTPTYYRLGRLLLSYTLLMLFAVMPFGKVKAQILWPNFTFSQSASNLCTGSVEFQVTSPNPVPSGYYFNYKINGSSTGEEGSDFYFSPNQNGNVVTYNITCEVNNGNGYTTNYGPFYVSSIAGLYVKKEPTYINDCSGNITLDASINGAVLSNAVVSGIIWYEYNNATLLGLLPKQTLLFKLELQPYRDISNLTVLLPFLLVL